MRDATEKKDPLKAGDDTAKRPRLKYEAPQLRRLGSLSEFTRGAFGTTNDHGGGLKSNP
jgi:hypothetical protein